MKRKIISAISKILFIAVLLSLAGCFAELSDDSSITDGIIIYSNREVLNNREVEIVEKRGQQLRATSPMGQNFVWESSRPAHIDIDQTGYIRAGQGINKFSVITVSLKDDPSVKAQVTFIIKGLR